MTDIQTMQDAIAAGICWHDPDTRIGCGAWVHDTTDRDYRITGWCEDCRAAVREMEAAKA